MEKHLKVTGTSSVSWKDAIVKTIEETSKTIQHISEIIVLNQRAKINENKIEQYYVDLDISFIIDRNLNQ